MALFERNPFPQDTGRLQERWQQDGSDVLDGTATHSGASSKETILTVSAGKAFYCKNISVTNRASSGNIVLTIQDDTTDKLTLAIQAETTVQISLLVPVKFLVDASITVAGDYSATLIGWEEPG